MKIRFFILIYRKFTIVIVTNELIILNNSFRLENVKQNKLLLYYLYIFLK